MPTFEELTPVAARIVAAGDHLTLRGLTGTFSCGCPGWSSSSPHSHDCPLLVLDQAFEAGHLLTHVMATLTAGSQSVTYEQVRAAMSHLEDDVLVRASASATLSLLGAARLYVTIAARTVGATHDLFDPAAERYAVLHRLTYDTAVALNAETAARLFVSPHTQTDLGRLAARVPIPDGAAAPTAGELPLRPLIPALLEGINVVISSLPAPGLSDVTLDTLAVEGFHLLAGLPSAAADA